MIHPFDIPPYRNGRQAVTDLRLELASPYHLLQFHLLYTYSTYNCPQFVYRRRRLCTIHLQWYAEQSDSWISICSTYVLGDAIEVYGSPSPAGGAYTVILDGQKPLSYNASATAPRPSTPLVSQHMHDQVPLT